MEIALLTPYFNQPRGNTITVQRIANGLQAAGVSVQILSIEEGQLPKLPEADLIHGFNAYQFYNYWSKKGDPTRPYMVTLTGTDLNHSLFCESTKGNVLQALNHAQAIHVFNENARETLLREVSHVADKTFVISQGLTSFSKEVGSYKKEPRTFLFLLPAGIRKVKNVPKAISMLGPLHHQFPFFRLWIVGPVIEYSEGVHVQELIEKNQDWVKYLGPVPHQEMAALYTCSDIVLNTSQSEGQSSAILEAMAMGRPVVASNIPGNSDLVTHEKTGFLYKDDKEFSRIIRELVENRDFLEEIGKAGQENVLQGHSVQKEIDALLDVYRQILNS